MEALLAVAARARCASLENDHKRYVGAQIGIHDPRGRRVGEVGRLRNKEFLYLVTPEPLSRRAQQDLETTTP